MKLVNMSPDALLHHSSSAGFLQLECSYSVPFGHRLVAMDGNNWTLFHYDYGTGYIGG